MTSEENKEPSAATSCWSARTRQTPLDSLGGRITLLILLPFLPSQSCERKSGEWKVFRIRKIHFFSVWNKKARVGSRSDGTKLESLELIGGNSRPPLLLDNMDHKISYKLKIFDQYSIDTKIWNSIVLCTILSKNISALISVISLLDDKISSNFKHWQEPKVSVWSGVRALLVHNCHTAAHVNQSPQNPAGRALATRSGIKPGFWHKDPLMASSKKQWKHASGS